MSQRSAALIGCAMIALSLLFVACLFDDGGGTGPEPDPIPEGILEYRLSGDGTVTVSGYSSDRIAGGSVSIPSTVSIDGGTYVVSAIGDLAFFDVDADTVHIPDTVVRIGDAAFYQSGIVSAIVPDSVKVLGTNVFAGCGSLVSVIFEGGVESIGDSAFFGCSSLETLVLPEGGRYSNLEGLVASDDGTLIAVMPSVTGQVRLDGISSIGGHAFSTSGADAVFISADVVDITSTAFNSSSVSRIDVDEGNPVYCSVDGVLYDREGDTLLRCPPGMEGVFEVPSAVTSLGSSSLAGCTGLTGISIGSSVEVHAQAFTGIGFYETVESEEPIPYWEIAGHAYQRIGDRMVRV